LRSTVKRQVKRFIRKLSFHKSNPSAAKKRQVWSIGIYAGQSLFDLAPAASGRNPVLTRENVSDIEARFVADPFMLRAKGTWHMFFEVMNRECGRGEIGLATSKNGLKWQYRQIVLTEPFHLSYPYVFEWMNDYYMIPETHKARSVRLYRASKFPQQWSFVSTLLEEQSFCDSSIFRYANTWWLYTETNPDYKFDTLRLYYAQDLVGPWIEHPQSPIIEGNPHTARPGGRVLVLGDRIVRYAQDCYPMYGTQIRAFEIIELTTTGYCEREACEHPILIPSGNGWNALGMHHVDPHQMDDGRWLACVDGWLNA